MSVTASCAGRRRWRRPSGWRGSACRCRARCARDLQAGGAALGADSEARRIFAGRRHAVTEGDTLTQPELAAHAGRRSASAAASISSRVSLARTMSEQIAQMGGSLPLETLRDAVPQAGRADRRRAMACAGESMSRRRRRPAPRRWPAGRARRRAAATPADSGGFAGLAAVDGKGGAAACSLSMGQLFGARAIVPGTGMLLGAPTADSTARSAR